MLEKALENASRITHPWTFAIVVVIIAVVVFAFALRTQTSRLPRPIWIVLAAGILTVGFVPAIASAFVRSRGLYRVRLVVVEPDKSLADYAQVKSSHGGELKMIAGGWELEIPPQTRPVDGMVTFSAVVKDEYRKGSSTLVLAEDYYPTVTVQLVADTSTMVRGVVADEDLRAIAGARVSIAGYSNVAVTDTKGNFALPAHAEKGQMVEIRATKDQLTGRLSAPAGRVVEVIMNPE